MIAYLDLVGDLAWLQYALGRCDAGQVLGIIERFPHGVAAGIEQPPICCYLRIAGTVNAEGIALECWLLNNARFAVLRRGDARLSHVDQRGVEVDNIRPF